ncbi:MAG: 8-amino-7-oxononanoate synthase [Steroidobacteraceae bacterium]
MKNDPQAVADALVDLEAAGRRRARRIVQGFAGDGSALRPVHDGRPLLNFCSNDYLDLAREPAIARAMADAAIHWGSGAGAAHLVTGHGAEHHALEEELAAFTGREAALLFSTGYMANLGVIGALAARGEIILEDKLNHASLLDGARLSDATLQRYPHADAGAAARLAHEAGARLSLIATDGVFSMDGDIAPLVELASMARAQRAWLLVDDAHGLGVMGATGRGSLELAGLDQDDVPLLVGTLGKALGCFGAFVAGRRDVVELIMQRARSYIFTTALPPAVAAATRAALATLQRQTWRRDRLAAGIARFRAAAATRDIALMPSSTPIQPVAVPGAVRCAAASDALRARGFWVAAIRSPTVPAGTERLRVTLTAAHRDEDIDALADALAEVLRALPVAPAMRERA